MGWSSASLTGSENGGDISPCLHHLKVLLFLKLSNYLNPQQAKKEKKAKLNLTAKKIEKQGNI